MIRKFATIEDLYEVEGKAELVNGEIVRMAPTGDLPSRVANGVNYSLANHMFAHGGGCPFMDGTGFLTNLPHRQSFCPDVAWYTGPSGEMRFLPEPPVFAVEVRSENDYGAAAERELAAKRADYFAAGTQVVWDVDLQSDELIRAYSATAPETPRIFRRGDVADAEPAVPGWRFPVDDLFRFFPPGATET